MLNYENIKKNKRQFYALTGHTVAEFEILHQYFEPRCERYFKHRTLEGKLRKRSQHRERQNASLKGTINKLFFLLVCKKNQASQQLIAASFGISQGKVSMWIKVLSTIYEKAVLDANLNNELSYSIAVDELTTSTNGIKK